jgi:hypothetical protein
MKFKDARFMKKGTVLWYGTCPVKFVRLEKFAGTWFAVVNDEKENPKHEDRLLIASLYREVPPA